MGTLGKNLSVIISLMLLIVGIGIGYIIGVGTAGQINDMRTQINSFQSQVTSLQNQVTSLQDEKTSLLAEISIPRNNITALQTQIQQLKDENTMLKGQAQRQENYKKELAIRLGLDPLPEKTPLNPQIVGIVERDDYRIESAVRVFQVSM